MASTLEQLLVAIFLNDIMPEIVKRKILALKTLTDSNALPSLTLLVLTEIELISGLTTSGKASHLWRTVHFYEQGGNGKQDGTT